MTVDQEKMEQQQALSTLTEKLEEMIQERKAHIKLVIIRV